MPLSHDHDTAHLDPDYDHRLGLDSIRRTHHIVIRHHREASMIDRHQGLGLGYILGNYAYAYDDAVLLFTETPSTKTYYYYTRTGLCADSIATTRTI